MTVTKPGDRRKTESDFTHWFCQAIEASGAEVRAFVGHTMQGGGLPDRYACHPKFRGWLEFKRGDRKLTGLQRAFMKRFSKRGDTCMVIRYRASEIMEIESWEGHPLSWTNLTPLYCLKSDQERGAALLEILKKAKEILWP